MNRIRIIQPVSRGEIDDGSLPSMPDFVDVEVDWLPDGARHSIECRGDSAETQVMILDRVRQAVADGVDGMVINCFMDPAVEPAREMSKVPVVGPAQSSLALAATLGERFSIIMPAESGEPIVRRQVRTYSDLSRLASVRSVDMPVAELDDTERLIAALAREGERAVTEDGAEVLILGCTGMSYATDVVRERLERLDVPVLDPTLCAVGAVLSQTIQSVGHSGLGYRLPDWRRAASASK